jgi:hypothetical protein
MKHAVGIGSALRGPMLMKAPMKPRNSVIAVTIVACFALMGAISVAEAGHGGGGHGGGGAQRLLYGHNLVGIAARLVRASRPSRHGWAV